MPNVIEHLAPACFTEINIDIRRRNAIGIQEALEEQIELQRIDVRDSEHVCHHRTGRRTTPRSHGNAALFRVMDEVPDDEKITDEAGLLEHVDFKIEPLDQLAIGSRAFAVAVVQPLVAKLPQVRFTRLAFRCGELRIFRNAELQFQVAALGDPQRVRDRVRMFRKQCAHFVRGFKVEFRHVMHPALVVHHLARADTDHDVVRFVVGTLQEMHVVRGH